MKRIKFEENIKSKNKILKSVKILAAVFLIIFLFEVWMTSRLSTYGNKIQEIKNTQAKLQLENQVLENQIAQSTSLLSLEKKSTELGFDSIKNLEYYRPANIASAF